MKGTARAAVAAGDIVSNASVGTAVLAALEVSFHTGLRVNVLIRSCGISARSSWPLLGRHCRTLQIICSVYASC